MYVPTPEQLSARVSAAVDTHRLIELVQQVCRIPSVLGEEGELADPGPAASAFPDGNRQLIGSIHSIGI